MSEQQPQPLIHYITVTRTLPFPIGEVWGILASFGGEKTWYPGCKRLTLTGFGIGSVRTFDYIYPPGTKNAGFEYTFSEEMTAVDGDSHSMTFRVRRPDYPDMVAFGTTVLDEVEGGTRFRWIGEGTELEEGQMGWLKENLDERFNALIDAIAGQLAKDVVL